MSLPLSRLASLDLIRGFVAVGRRMSITLAAQDLFLTQSAVSRQIRALEEAVGVRLLARGHRSIRFTPEGERLFRVADRAVGQLQDVLGELTAAQEQRSVTITASIGVAGLWLLPMLGRFQQRCPDIDVRVAANNRLLDLRAEGVDLAIRYCAANNAPAGAVRLFGDSVLPVAHPSLGRVKLDEPGQLADIVLLEYDDPRLPWLHWSEWLQAMGLDGHRPKAILRFNQYDQVIHAAMAGQGIALGRLELIRSLLDEDRLTVVESKGQALSGGYAYWLLHAESSPREPVRKVADWLLEEAGQMGGKQATQQPA